MVSYFFNLNLYVRGERDMKKLYIILITVLFAVTSSIGFAAGGHRSGGSVHVGSEGVTGAPFATPRGFGEEEFQDETHMFNDAAPGAWSNDPEPGKDKPSSDK
jgi:hypothetical protein